MRMSQLFTKTSKTAPSDEVAKNARLLIRAGFVHKEMAGVYAYLPLGLRVIEKIKQIVREEMESINSNELIMTGLQRKTIWEKTGRWDDEKVDVWFKTRLKDDTELGLGWSHEEPIVEMVRGHLNSYKDLPISVYQFQTKMRNELRAKSGIMRGREFIMKDMYSFHASKADLDAYYDHAIEAYKRVFERLGLGDETFVTFASGGAFTKYSHEFQTVCDAGEDYIYKVPSTGETFNEEIAPSKAPVWLAEEAIKPLQEVEGKKIIGVDALANFLGIHVSDTTKTMLYVNENDEVIAAAVRGGYSVNEEKLAAVVGAERIRLADEATVKRVTGAEVDYAGIMNLPDSVRVVVDESCANRVNFEMGANRTNFHCINVNWGRDLLEPEAYHDIKTAQEGDLYPETGEVYEKIKTAETGNIFNFGTQKTDEMGLYYTDAEGKQQSLYIGSYGIGVTRVMGVIAEKLSDDKGLAWPKSIAPYRVYLISIGEKGVAEADSIYQELTEKGVEVLYDDRNERPGAKFADAELIGIPTRVTISDRSIDGDGLFEMTDRANGEVERLSRQQLVESLIPTN